MIEYLEAGLKPETTNRHLGQLLSQHAPSASEQSLEQLAKIVADLLDSIPRNIRLINAYQAHPLCRKPLGYAFGQVLVYCFDENDLLPEQQFGTLGLIDDAYLLHVFSRLLPLYFPYAVPANVESTEFEFREVLDRLLPAGVLDALDKTARSLLEISVALFGNALIEENSNKGYPISLNVQGAVDSLKS